MANTKSTQHEIDLTSGLNLNKFKADIKPYEGFNERNAPYYGGCLSPLYIKDDGEVTAYTKYVDGVKWETKDGKLYKNDEEVMSFENTQFVKSYVSDIPGFVGKDILDYYDENNYIEQVDNRIVLHHNGQRQEFAGCNYIDSRFSIAGSGSQLTVHFALLVKVNATSDYYVKRRCYFDKNDTVTYIDFPKNSDFISYFYAGPLYIQVDEVIYDRVNSRFIGFGWTGNEAGSYQDCYVYYDGRALRIYSDDNTYYSRYDGNAKNKNILQFLLEHGGARLPIFNVGFNDCFFLNVTTGQIALERARCYYSVETTAAGFPILVIRYSTGSHPQINVSQPYSNYKLRTFCGKYFPFISAAVDNLANENEKLMGVTIYNNGIEQVDNAICDNYSIYNNGNGDFMVPSGGLSYNNLITDNVGNPLAMAYNGTLLTSWGSVGLRPFYSNKYYDDDLKGWVIIDRVTGNNSFKIIDDYVVVNTTSYYNCYNMKTQKKYHWGSCWYNNVYSRGASRIIDACIMAFDTYPTKAGWKSEKVSVGENINWLLQAPSSAKFGPVIVYHSGELVPYGNKVDPQNPLNLYVDDKYVKSFVNASYYYNSYTSIEEPALENTTYPGDAVRYNIPLLFDVISGVLDTTIVNFGSDVSFFTIYYDNRQRYQYYSSSITEFEQFFIIQAQAYGIKDKKIYAVSYLNNVIQASQAVVSIEGLQFVGNTIYNAYFYSPTTKAIYSFGADNNLVVFAQADTFDGITGSSYLPGTSSIILGTPDCAYVLNEKFGIYRLNDIKNLRYASQKPDSVVLVLDDHAYEISYIDRDTTEDWEKIDIVCDTAFYGAGSNVVSVNDCWYVRITDSEHKAGEIKLAVSTLTDIGRSTETRTFKVKESDWDELTDTIYIRFQPKLQRAVGVSLHIESPFKIGYIGVGATPETLQLNKGTI